MLANTFSANKCLRRLILRYPGRRTLRSKLTSRFHKQEERPPLEEIVSPQRVPMERYTCIDFEGIDPVTRDFISKTLDKFVRQPYIRELAEEHNIKGVLFDKAFQSFRLHCCSEDNFYQQNIEPGLRILFSDIQNEEQSVDSIYPFFVKHARRVFPHLECIKELQMISDLTQPHNWYPTARDIFRKVVFHAGPTNSGKTYEALKVLKKANSGMYCGPLRLLAREVYERINNDGIPCDMITGENRLFVSDDPDKPAPHCAITVEMIPVDKRVDVVVIDEIQMVRDPQRGAAFTRALLGAATDELHLCGEESAVDIVTRLLDPIGEHVDVRRYKRKGDLVVSTHGLRELDKLQDGDCVVHFSKIGILQMARRLKSQYGRDCAIIFGDLPPETKRAQVRRFNDPEDPCKILLATDAIGMGMNLNIRRIIFSSLNLRSGELPAYHVKQIAGRAGRYNSQYCTGEVLTMNDEDMSTLARLMNEPIQPIEKAGIGPYYDLFEMFSLHLPHCSFLQLIDIFVSIATVSDHYFVCMWDSMRDLAMLIEHIPLSLRERYVFCLCPIGAGLDRPLLNTAFVKMVRHYSEGNAISFAWVHKFVGPEMKVVAKLEALNRLVEIYDFINAYLWISYRFEDYFPHREEVRQLQFRCAETINKSVEKILMESDHLPKENKGVADADSKSSQDSSASINGYPKPLSSANQNRRVLDRPVVKIQNLELIRKVQAAASAAAAKVGLKPKAPLNNGVMSGKMSDIVLKIINRRRTKEEPTETKQGQRERRMAETRSRRGGRKAKTK